MIKLLTSILQILCGLLLIGGFFYGIYFFRKTEKEQQANLYQVNFQSRTFWAREIIFKPNSVIEFIDVNTNRKLIVSQNYWIIEPKINK